MVGNFNRRSRAGVFLWITLGALLLAEGAILAQAAEVIKQVKVVMDDNYPPYTFRDNEGKLQGILIDQWRLWEAKTGVKVEIEAKAWYLALRQMEEGQFDVIDTIFKNEKRTRTLDFLPAYAKLEVPIFFRRDLTGIKDASSLQDFTVAVKSSDAALDYLQGVRKIEKFSSYDAIIDRVRSNQVSVFVMDKPPALYLLYKYGLEDQFKMSAPLYVGEFHRAVKKGRTELRQTLARGFALISEEEYRKIDERWLGAQPFKPAYLRFVGLGFALGLALLCVLFLWNWLLRRAVHEQTARLEQEVALSHRREQALLESEERFRRFIEHFPGLVFIKDASLRTVMLSKMFQTLLGRPLPDMLGKTNEELFPEIADQLNGDDRKVLDLAYGEYLVLEETFKDRIYLTYKFPVDNGGQKMIGGVTIDITERKRGEEERRKLENRMQQAQKLESLGVMAGGIAHDFNNILMAILGNIELALMETPAVPAVRSCLSEAAKASRRAADLCRQMLAYAGKAGFVVELLDLNRLLQDMVHLIEISISKSAVLQWNLAENLPPVSADSTQLRQIVMNLVINASEAIGSKVGVITLSTGAQYCTRTELASQWLNDDLPEGCYAFFEVADSGKGMDAETLSKIFDPFFTTKFTGRGLGLAAVLGIVRGHHGAIQVRSTVDAGSSFRVLLPAAGGPVRPTSVSSKSVLPWRGSGTVLLVDDEASVRETVQRMLERFGFAVLTAAHGLEALDIFRAQPDRISLVLLDLNMPQLDGEGTLRELRKIRPEVRVVLSSGYDARDLASRFSGEGLVGFIQKPYAPENLSAALQKALRTTDPAGKA